MKTAHLLRCLASGTVLIGRELQELAAETLSRSVIVIVL
jgi:hypothetical protein